MNILLISTYEMGRQPLGLASPAAWLGSAGHHVTCADLSVSQLPEEAARAAGLIALYLPMHTATRLAVKLIPALREINPGAHLCGYGLYAPLNEGHLRELGVGTILGGEFEPELVALAAALEHGDPAPQGPLIALGKLRFQVPDRSGLPPAEKYAHLQKDGLSIPAGYTEASRGCRHLCRHCPVVPVYNGTFRVVQADVVLEDIRRQVRNGAGHIAFGDPDFFNGPLHARRIVESLHREFPGVTYDVTIKVEHLRQHRELIPVLKDTGCLFVTSAVESLDNAVLAKLDKGHTRADFIACVADCRRFGLTLAPTFIAFTPWTTLASYREFLAVLNELDLVENVSPVQLALRLLIPSGSRMLELEDVTAVLDGYDAPALLHRWKHPDPEVDRLAEAAIEVAAGAGSRRQLFRRFWELAQGAPLPDDFDLTPRAAIPYMNEPWYC